MDKKKVINEKNTVSYEFPDLKELRKVGSEQEILARLEEELKNLIQTKKKLKNELQSRIEEINKWFENEWQKITKFENKMILLWDFQQREVEILALEKQLKDQSLSANHEEITRKKDKLILINTNLERGYKREEIDKERLAELRKKLGAWEE
jgi:hypothetical protein